MGKEKSDYMKKRDAAKAAQNSQPKPKPNKIISNPAGKPDTSAGVAGPQKPPAGAGKYMPIVHAPKVNYPPKPSGPGRRK